MLPEAWIDKLFDEMSGMYGSKFADLWKGSNIETVRRIWAEKLAGFADQPKAIRMALNSLEERPFPPTLPEFIVLCREAAKRLRDDTKALPHKLTAEEQERNDRLAREIAEKAKRAEHRDPLGWAKRPGSHIAFAYVLKFAAEDQRGRDILADLVAQGVTDGKALLKRWAGNDGWVKA